MGREQIARDKHKNGYNCAKAVYTTFDDKVSGFAPMPRSEGGKCGTVLAAEKILAELGLDAAAFDKQFMEAYGTLKCKELRQGKYPCNDLVGCATKMIEALIESSTAK